MRVSCATIISVASPLYSLSSDVFTGTYCVIYYHVKKHEL
jgi:hypothetical protein